MLRWPRFKRLVLILFLCFAAVYTLCGRRFSYHQSARGYIPSILGVPNFLGFSKSQVAQEDAQTIYNAKLAQHRMPYLTPDFYLDASAERLQIPSYFADNSKLPILQPHDPRFTLGIYASYIGRHINSNDDNSLSVPFHWSDWTNLSFLDPYMYAPAGKRAQCSMFDDKKAIAEMRAEKQTPKPKLSMSNTVKWRNILVSWVKFANKRLGKRGMTTKYKADAFGTLLNLTGAFESDENTTNYLEIVETDLGDLVHAIESLEKRAVPPKDLTKGATEFCVEDRDLPLLITKGKMRFPGVNVFAPALRTSLEHAILTSRSYLHTFAPPPESILFLTENGAYVVDVDKEPARLLENTLVQDHISSQEGNVMEINAMEEMARLKANVAELIVASVAHPEQIFLNESDFSVDVLHQALRLELRQKSDNGALTARELKYLKSMRSRTSPFSEPKYFSEARLISGLAGDHYDWRFFNGLVLDQYEREIVFHRLTRAWFSFCRVSGLRSWLAHGALLSWYWNAMAFPWDLDLDVQMPIRDLHNLASMYNETLVVENINEGTGRYYIDCSTYIGTRIKGGGSNMIDARFIDVDTGLYIDITGLSVSSAVSPKNYINMLSDADRVKGKLASSNPKLKVYNCRNNHFLSLDEISPLQQTLMEGRVVYVPHKSTKELQKEYPKGLSTAFHNGYYFLDELRIWVEEKELFHFLFNHEKWLAFHKARDEFLDTEKSVLPEEARAKFDSFAEARSLAYEPLPKRQVAQRALVVEKFEAGSLVEALDPIIREVANPVISNLMPRALKEIQHDILLLLNHDEIFRAYWHARTAVAIREFDPTDKSQSHILLPQSKARDEPPFKCDPFLYRIHKTGRSWDEELQRHAKLAASAA